MENLNFELTEDKKLRLTDFPNAEKAIKLSGKRAQELADMALHMSDLYMAKEYLQLSQGEAQSSIQQIGLLNIAIISYLKCFGNNNARVTRLNIEHILPGDTLGYEIHGYFKDLRDKNIAHDDNALTQCLVGAVLNKIDAPYKIEKIVNMNMLGMMNTSEVDSNLSGLIEKALEFSSKRYDELCVEITNELEALPYARLSEYETLNYRAPLVEEFGKSRKKLSII